MANALRVNGGGQLAQASGGALTEHDKQQLVTTARTIQQTMSKSLTPDAWVSAATETGGGVNYCEEITITFGDER